MFLKQLHWKLFDNPDRILWPNVLDCIALSLLVTVTITLFAPFRRTILALIFASLFIIAPLVQKPHTFGVLTPLINNSVYSDTWPLVPWGGYACLGAVIGLSLNTKDGRSRFPQLFLALGITGLLTSICWPLLDLIYLPKYTAFYITNAGERSAYIGFIALMLWGLEQASHKHLWIVQNPFAWLIELYSRQSLVAYIGHLVIFYGIGWFRPYNRFHQQCGWWSYALLSISLMAVTAIVCYLFDLLSKAMQKNPIRQGISPPKPAMILNHD